MIRPATLDDAPVIGQMWEKLLAYHLEFDNRLPRAAPNGAHLYARNIAERLYDSHTRVLVAEEDGRVVGYVLGLMVDLVPEMFEQEPGGFLADIFVEAPYRGRGIGRALVEALTAWFHEQGLHRYECFVASSNVDAQAFWRALGGRDLMVRMRADVRSDD